MSKIRVLLVDDHPIMLEGLRVLLSCVVGVEVVGEAVDGVAAVAQVDALRPDVVIMDVAMPKMNGIAATRLIRAQHPETRILILTQHEQPEYILPLLKAGASGIVLKRGMVSDLRAALQVVAQGETFIYPAIATLIVDMIRCKVDSSPAVRVSLTAREQEVLKHIVTGETNAQIAEALSVSVKTVQFHRTNVMEKLGVHSAVDLVREALRYGLVEVDDHRLARETTWST